MLPPVLHYKRCREKLHAALYRLAVGEGDVRDRLRGAHRYLRMLSEDEVPPSIREEWSGILLALTRRGPMFGPNGDVWKPALDNTLDRIRNSTGRRIAERIYAMVGDFNEAVNDRRPRRGVWSGRIPGNSRQHANAGAGK
ncbi:hypothetical protein LJR130_003803 [Variovorax sp. LjRoot130]|uniref:hypothetical protein n=1 Tax=unclassified Variovorax TaxID=663243 RepID=UPI003ECE704A